MLWPSILNFFTQAISISDVAMLVALVWIIRSQRHTKELLLSKIEAIDKALNNHVTGTESKIRDLKNELKEDNRELRKDNRELKEDNRELRKETKESHIRLENKIDKLAEEIRAKDKDKK